ncbi:MAG: site-specific DNA-methyltransferase [Chloroflexi bacterium]|nr:site-specific DNA-methyltransferase [Chloroflexota bacterium]
MKTNVLYYGDNLEILRKYIPDSSVDLIYLDPPFNSKKDYNVLFKENGGVESEAQIQAFSDTWHWTKNARDTYHDIVANGPLKVGMLIGALHEAIGNNDVMAYLVMMTARLIELHRVLKPTGSLYLHCDPTASHYLKIVLDQVFGPANFRNEIVWKRTHAHSGGKRYGAVHDVLFFYSKTSQYTWKTQYVSYSQRYIDDFFRFSDPDGRRYRATILTGSGTRKGSSGKPWRGIDPTASGRHWAIPGYARPLLGRKALTDVQAALERLDTIGRILWPAKPGGIPSFKQYLDDLTGVELQDTWTDIPPISAQAKERLGYETQKPLELLERIINTSSNKGDIVLDPFCGCGTAVVAAEKLKRKWLGIDITHLAIALMRNRLKDSFGMDAEVIGEPVDTASARALAHQDRYQFQWWALSLIKARPAGDKKKGADKGIDGVIHFIDEVSGKPRRVVVQVKSGHVAVNAVRELRTVAANEAIGVLITLEEPTVPMKTEALDAGYYHSPIWDKDYPKIQIFTIEELLHGKAVYMPPQTQTSVTFAKAQKLAQKHGEQLVLEAQSIYDPGQS